MSEQKVVTEMFNDISPRYDFLNHLLSFGIDRCWRRKTSRIVTKRHPATILDVATGTADLTIQLAKDNPTATITGVDLSEKMLEIGRKKISKKQLDHRITLEISDAVQLSFPNNNFDAVTVAFGVRNFEDIEKGLQEMFRVSKDGGMLAVLEFSRPKSFWIRAPYNIYSQKLLPFVGRVISGHRNAYRYLPTSIEQFPDAETLTKMMERNGFRDIKKEMFSGGIVTLYYGYARKKPLVSQ
jgi:demethylmenaquinone methyltransferase/2-methoxy-6-polyprenyl-1,4-benzoquinol methylase